MERLTILRGKAMPARYSWSCKRSYKNGFVWNDLTENDAIYASEGSEYILKGSELFQDGAFSELAESRVEELQTKVTQQKKDTNKLGTNGLITSKVHPRPSYRQIVSDHGERQAEHIYDVNGSNNEYEEEEDEEEKRVSCNSSNATYSKPAVDDCQLMMQMEQDESYSLPSTSSTNSDKQLPAPPLAKTTASSAKEMRPTAASDSKRFEKDITVEEDGDPLPPLSRNAVLLQLIACGGGGYVGNKAKVKANKNFNMRNTFIPCLKQQLSTKGMNLTNNPLHKAVGTVGEQRSCSCKAADCTDQQVNKVEDDEDMIMVRYMSENPRFGNLQSEEKEYFSGTIVETMTHHHTQSFGSASSRAHIEGHTYSNQHHPPVFTKSSSFNEQSSAKVGLQAAASNELEEDENDDLKVTGIIKLCLPRKKSCSSASTKSNKL